MSTLQISTTKADSSESELHAGPAGAGLLNRVWEGIAAFVAYLALRRAEMELMALDDRMLKDIGIDRAGIKWALMMDARDRSREARSRHRHDRVIGA
jgi:uncharacterized protein YjiS (DUF1127 family)